MNKFHEIILQIDGNIMTAGCFALDFVECRILICASLKSRFLLAQVTFAKFRVLRISEANFDDHQSKKQSFANSEQKVNLTLFKKHDFGCRSWEKHDLLLLTDLKLK